LQITKTMLTQLESTYFFTATIHNWQLLLHRDERKEIIINSLKYMCEKDRIKLHAFVIMPNHLHLVLTLGVNETILSFQRDFLKFRAQWLIKGIIKNKELAELNNYKSTQKDRIYQVWERRPKWIKIENALILAQKIGYIHTNPLQDKWHLVSSPEIYEWSSASFYLGEDSRFSFLTDFDD
jgi:putative transposase